MLSTVDSIIEALGGASATASLAGVGLSAVSNWKARGAIPAEKFMLVSTALRGRDKGTPDPAVFGFEAAAETRQ